MELNRRQFLWVLLGAVGVVALASLRLARRVFSAPVVRAFPGRVYPGRVKPLQPADIGRRGPWAG